MRQKRNTETDSAIMIMSKTGAIMVLALNRSDKSYNADDTKKLALAAMRAATTDPQQKKAGFWTKRSLSLATADELAKLGLQRIVSVDVTSKLTKPKSRGDIITALRAGGYDGPVSYGKEELMAILDKRQSAVSPPAAV